MAAATGRYDRIARMILAMEAGALSAGELRSFAQDHFVDPEPLAIELRTWPLERLRQHLNARLQGLDHEATVRAFVRELAKRLAPVFGIAAAPQPYLLDEDPFQLRPILQAIEDTTDEHLAAYVTELRSFRRTIRAQRDDIMRRVRHPHGSEDAALAREFREEGHGITAPRRITVASDGGLTQAQWTNRMLHLPLDPSVIGQLIHLAGLTPNHRVLVPHAALGCLARGVRHSGVAQLRCFEADPGFRACLAHEGFDLVGFDFLSEPPGSTRYDRVIGHFPVEPDHALRLLKHAREYLVVGGHLVVLLSLRHAGGSVLGALLDWLGPQGGSWHEFTPDLRTATLGVRRLVIQLTRSSSEPGLGS